MKITIVIPNYNGKHFLAPCLDSLQAQTYQNFEIIIVDNASSDGSIEYLHDHYPQINTIVLRENYGFSRAVNEGIRASAATYVILLNNDTVVAPTYVEALYKYIRTRKTAFSASSKMLQMHSPELIDSAGDLYTLLGWGVCRGSGRSAAAFTRSGKVFSACAGAAIYRRNVFERIGYFDESHFAYLEDIDIGYRAKIYGYCNLYCPDAIVYHVGSGTSGSKYNTFKVKHSARNSIYLNYKNMPFLQLLLNAVPLLTGYIIKYFFFLKIGFGKDYMSGIREGFATLHHCRKVPFHPRHIKNYICIQFQLIKNTFSYAKDWLQRRLLKK